jgi:hypothetical protein
MAALILVYWSYLPNSFTRHFDVRFTHTIATDSKSQERCPPHKHFFACLKINLRAEIVQFLGKMLRVRKNAAPHGLEIRQH